MNATILRRNFVHLGGDIFSRQAGRNIMKSSFKVRKLIFLIKRPWESYRSASQPSNHDGLGSIGDVKGDTEI